ncbi:hypothetical protein B0H21DRAFT_884993 [Amylocystis lapponica]|nr:hypothetical protein B0H21DRAFT_884993 [Amylocystis lapponica]
MYSQKIHNISGRYNGGTFDTNIKDGHFDGHQRTLRQRPSMTVIVGYVLCNANIFDYVCSVTEEQAIACLVAWTAANDQDKVTWQAQLDTTAATAVQRAQELTEAEQQRTLEAAQEAEQYHPIPMRPTPRTDLVLAAPYALKRLEKALYLELYYYTNTGLNTANLAVSGLDDKFIMTMQRGDNSIASWVPAVTAKAAKSVIDDQDLTWEQVMEAVPCFITAIESARWDPSCGFHYCSTISHIPGICPVY